MLETSFSFEKLPFLVTFEASVINLFGIGRASLLLIIIISLFLALVMQMESVLDLVSADDYFVMCQNAPYGQVFVLPSRRLVYPASDDAFVTLR